MTPNATDYKFKGILSPHKFEELSQKSVNLEPGDVYFVPFNQSLMIVVNENGDLEGTNLVLAYLDKLSDRSKTSVSNFASNMVYADKNREFCLLMEPTDYGPTGTVIYWSSQSGPEDGLWKTLTVLAEDDLIYKPQNMLEVLQVISSNFETSNLFDAAWEAAKCIIDRDFTLKDFESAVAEEASYAGK